MGVGGGEGVLQHLLSQCNTAVRQVAGRATDRAYWAVPAFPMQLKAKVRWQRAASGGLALKALPSAARASEARRIETSEKGGAWREEGVLDVRVMRMAVSVHLPVRRDGNLGPIRRIEFLIREIIRHRFRKRSAVKFPISV